MDLNSLPDRPLRETEFEKLRDTDSVDIIQGTSTVGFGDYEGSGEVYEFALLTDEWVCAVLYVPERTTWVASEKTEYPDGFDHDSFEDQYMFSGLVIEEHREQLGVDPDDTNPF